MAATDELDEKSRSRNLNDYAEFFLQLPPGAQARLGPLLASLQRDRIAALQQGKEREHDRQLLHAVAALQQTYQHFMWELDIEDRAADMALADIAREIEANRRECENLLENAYRMPDGRRVFMTEDGTAVYDEDGNRLSAADAANLPKNELRRHSSWEQMQANADEHARLEREQQDIVRYKQEGQELKERAESGDLSPEEFADIERRRQETMPERMRPYADHLRTTTPEPSQHPDVLLSPEEEAGLDARAGPSAATAYLGQAAFQGTAPASAPFNMAATGLAADRKVQPATAPAPQSGLDFA